MQWGNNSVLDDGRIQQEQNAEAREDLQQLQQLLFSDRHGFSPDKKYPLNAGILKLKVLFLCSSYFAIAQVLLPFAIRPCLYFSSARLFNEVEGKSRQEN